MIQRPSLSYNRRRLACSAIALVPLLIAMAIVPMVSADNGTQSTGIAMFDETQATTNLEKNTPEDPVVALRLYRQNLTYPKNRIPDNLLQITDPNYPKIKVSVDELKRFMILSNQLIPADQAVTKFNLSNKTGNSTGDLVHLIIHLNSTAPLQLIDPIATSVTTRNAEFHVVVVWIDVKNLEALVSMEGVNRIDLVVPPEHSAGSNSTSPIETESLITQNGSLLPFSSITKTPASSISPNAVFYSLLVTAIVMTIFSQWKRH